jgi:hypothetical protein
LDTTLIRNLFFMAQVQPAVVPVIEQLEIGRSGAMEALVERLLGADRLDANLTRSQAVDLLLVVTNFAAWDQLVTLRGRTPSAATAVLVDLAVRAVIERN